MKALYSTDLPPAKEARLRKAKFLRRFQSDGFYLIDAVSKPIKIKNRRAKLQAVSEELLELMRGIKGMANERTWVVLISKPVYTVCCEALRNQGVQVANEEPIEFPSFRWQKAYRMKLARTLEQVGWRPSRLSTQ